MEKFKKYKVIVTGIPCDLFEAAEKEARNEEKHNYQLINEKIAEYNKKLNDESKDIDLALRRIFVMNARKVSQKLHNS